jgi:hypothetical protein
VAPPFDMEAFARSSVDGLSAVAAAATNECASRIDPSPPPRPIEPTPVVTIEEEPGPEVVADRTIDDPVVEMHEAFASGAYEEALAFADLILCDDPGNGSALGYRAAALLALGWFPANEGPP